MKSIIKKFQILFVACAAVSSLASSVVEDSKKHFILDDEVLNSSKEACSEGSGMQFLPENAYYSDSNAVPFRYYRLALPSNAKPSISVTDSKLVPLGTSLCKSTPAKFLPVSVSEPFLKDNLWMADVRVPLYVKSGSSVSLRKSFRLKVDFASTSVGGQNPGARALMFVSNPKAGAQFGVARGSSSALRREATSEIDGIVKIAEFVVGEQKTEKSNMATFGEDGLYAIDYSKIVNALVDAKRDTTVLHGIPVEKICVYGAAPDTLQDMAPGAKLRNPNQVFELPIRVYDKNSNKIFDKGDSIYFVGYGSAFWKRGDSLSASALNKNMNYYHSYSPYSFFQNFIFGYKEVGSGLRMETLDAPKSSPKDIEWYRYVRAEKDLLLIDTYFGKAQDWEQATGKEWFWKWHSRSETTVLLPSELKFSTTTDLPGLVSSDKGFVEVSYFPYRSTISTGNVDQSVDALFSTKSYLSRMVGIRFSMSVNGESHDWSDAVLLPGGNFGINFSSLKSSGNEYEITMLPNQFQYDRFDGYTVAYQWDPSTVSIDSAEWMLPGFATGVVRIPVGKDSDLRLMKFKDFKPVGLLNISNGYAVDSIGKDEDVRYMIYRDSDRRKAFSVKGIPEPSVNVVQKLSQISTKTEYLIITPEAFLAPAESLATFRSSDKAANPLVTTVVAAENIYRHYTGGAMSPVAIRNFIAYARSVCPDLQFVLLAGSGHFDYRDINGKYGTIYIPPFEKEVAATEDFFAVLDSGEVVRDSSNYDVDVALGRVPVSSVSEFYDYIEKAKDYDQIGRFDHGDWRSTLLFAADDARNGTEQDDARHTESEEKIAKAIDSIAQSLGFRWNMKKVYLLDYEYDAAGQKHDAANDFMNILNQGALMTTYFGHGSKVAWASEGLLKVSYTSKLSNKKKYTVLNSFACSVGRFDEGNNRSITEEFVLTPEAGAIVAVAATRETFANHNETFAKNFINRALLVNGNYLGVAYMLAKDNVFKVDANEKKRAVQNSELYVYMGEPVIRMPYADFKISMDSPVDSIQALDKMKLSGTVSGLSTGNIALSLREGRVTKSLPTLTTNNDTIAVPYDGPIIYSEVIPVSGGRFETEFITPKKLNFGDTLAELRAWAYSSNDVAVGRYLEEKLRIAGVSNYADSLNDDTPPTIRIQSCYAGASSSFADNQYVKLPTPACLQIVVEDETALDYREQADEGITFEMVGLENPYHPTPFLEQSSKRAVARKSMTSEAYPPGEYVFKVRAQDVLGNATSKQVNLIITDAVQSGLSDVYNAPNPMGKKGTTFYFTNLSESQSAKVTIFIYNQNGRLVKVLKDAKSGETHWDGKDNYGRLLANGLYHYVVRSEVTTTTDSKKTKTNTWTKKQKLLISR